MMLTSSKSMLMIIMLMMMMMMMLTSSKGIAKAVNPSFAISALTRATCVITIIITINCNHNGHSYRIMSWDQCQPTDLLTSVDPIGWYRIIWSTVVDVSLPSLQKIALILSKRPLRAW